MVFDIHQLKKIRKQLNLTQQQFAKQANMSQSMIAKIEAGTLDPTYTYVQRIEETLTRLTKIEEKEAKDIMQKNIITLNPKDTIKKAAHTMTHHGISQLPILENNIVVGLVTETDILASIEKPNTQIKDIMKEPTPILSKNTKTSTITSLLKHFPILLIQEKGKLTGIITKADLIKSI